VRKRGKELKIWIQIHPTFTPPSLASAFPNKSQLEGTVQQPTQHQGCAVETATTLFPHHQGHRQTRQQQPAALLPACRQGWNFLKQLANRSCHGSGCRALSFGRLLTGVGSRGSVW
jgi:hypothetical protein